MAPYLRHSAGRRARPSASSTGTARWVGPRRKPQGIYPQICNHCSCLKLLYLLNILNLWFIFGKWNLEILVAFDRHTHLRAPGRRRGSCSPRGTRNALPVSGCSRCCSGTLTCFYLEKYMALKCLGQKTVGKSYAPLWVPARVAEQ